MILLVVLIIYAGKYAVKEKEEIPEEYKQTDISILSNLRDSAGAGVVKESDSQADKQAREAMQTDHTAERSDKLVIVNHVLLDGRACKGKTPVHFKIYSIIDSEMDRGFCYIL